MPTGELVRKGSLTREVIFDALGAQTGGGAGGTLMYNQATTWTNNMPSTGIPGGANQRLGVTPANSTVHTERVVIPGHANPSRLGCQLTLHVAVDGKIQAWELNGSECFAESLDRLKRS